MTSALRSMRAPLTGILALVLIASAAAASVGDYVVSDPTRVYYGNSRLFQRPAGVDCDRVYDHIAEYQQIVRRGLTEKDPEYHLLLQKATRRFSEAVKKMARSNNHDLVAHVGAVQKASEKVADVPNRTADVVQALD